MTADEAVRLAEWRGHTMQPWAHIRGWSCECSAMLWATGQRPRGNALTEDHAACVERQRRNAYERDRWLRKHGLALEEWPQSPAAGGGA